MPPELRPVSLSQFCELVGIDPPERLIGVRVFRRAKTVELILEPEDPCPATNQK